MLKKIRIFSLSLFILELFSGIVYSSLVFSFWIIYAIIAFGEAAVFGYICYLCRIRYAMESTYYDYDETYVVKDDEHNNEEDNNNNNSNNNNVLPIDSPYTQWTFDTPLPPMPNGATNPYIIHSEES